MPPPHQEEVGPRELPREVNDGLAASHELIRRIHTATRPTISLDATLDSDSNFNLMQTMKGDYVEAARARGVSERRVVFHHAFRNAMVPVITIAGLQFAILLGFALFAPTTSPADSA